MIDHKRPSVTLTSFLYKQLFGAVLENDEGADAERLTQFALATLQQVSLRRHWPLMSTVLQRISQDLQIKDSRLEQTIFGCNFPNPIGLAAGFDKNGVAAGIWDQFGFGFAELGTITFHPQRGNPRPRLFRLASESAALNRMGFNSKGASSVNKTLINQQLNPPGRRPLIIGINVGKSKVTPLEDSPRDYCSSFKLLASHADYVVINVSSPNTPRLRELQTVEKLKQIISSLRATSTNTPLLVKIAPDLNNEDIRQIAELAIQEQLEGIIAVNTSINRFGLESRIMPHSGLTLSQENGGLSGKPLRKRALEVIRLLRNNAGPRLPLIGVGGIDSAQSAWERISAGASLVQIYTGWIFQGPGLVPEITNGLLSQMDRHGLESISEAVGKELPWV